jgi:hypothetical protein
MAATVTKIWNQANGAGLLTAQISRDIVVGEFVGSGDANISELEPSAAFDVVTYLDTTSSKGFSIERFARS